MKPQNTPQVAVAESTSSYLMASGSETSDVASQYKTMVTAIDGSAKMKMLRPQWKFQQFIDGMKLPPTMPYHYCRAAYKVQPDEVASKIKAIQHIFYESAEVNDTQRTIWPHLMARKSALLVCDFEDLPYSMYIKPICWLVSVRTF